ncbi:phosphoglycerate kinase [Desulfonatronum thiosulfatophilum]|uniref:Phosphoglycerate kinase n=1 Tax=Desulfonatronum thiosulfatophilum TaxID=617002 RepID=A0A1G6CM08_9BACT|nr:phosphoglycerate kinase [Desulfonatronum thiosulfatophilum]SDB33812.1 phosphoglycerate kinase [Desulfonatronum thiosulfatophilum]
MSMRFLKDMDVKGKRLLIRVDYNVPIDQGVIQEDTRIKASLPTLKLALDQGASLVLCSHMGRPKGEAVPELSLQPIARRLSELLGQDVAMAKDCVGPKVESMAQALQPGQILLLENLRFHAGETKNDPDFSAKLAKLAEIYVNDAFGTAHRAHASNSGITKFIPYCCAGLLMQKEWEYLGQALAAPKRPFVAVSGGAKVSGKIGILNNLLDKVDRLIIGGAMANTFIKAQGYPVGASLVENDLLDTAREIMDKAKERGVDLHLPVDFIHAAGLKVEQAEGICGYQEIPEGQMVLDIGPVTQAQFTEVLEGAGTVVWNGPMGAFENPAFASGSMHMAKIVAELAEVSIVGGGDTDAMLHASGMADKISFISTGGGAFLEFMEGKDLPAFKALKECK